MLQWISFIFLEVDFWSDPTTEDFTFLLNPNNVEVLKMLDKRKILYKVPRKMRLPSKLFSIFYSFLQPTFKKKLRGTHHFWLINEWFKDVIKTKKRCVFWCKVMCSCLESRRRTHFVIRNKIIISIIIRRELHSGILSLISSVSQWEAATTQENLEK